MTAVPGRDGHPRRRGRRRGGDVLRAALPVDQRGRDLRQEPGRRVERRAAVPVPRRGPGQVQPLLRAGDPDVGEPPLLLQLALVGQRPGVREHLLLHAGEEHHGELEALGGVQRHQRHHAAVVLAVGDLVRVRDERDPLEEVGERAVRSGAVELARHRDHFLQVLHARGVLQVLGVLEVGLQPGLESSTASTSSATGPPLAACSRSSPTRALKPAIAAADRAARAGTSPGVRSAWANVIRSRDAYEATYSSARSPMPRLGTLSTRRSDTSSAGLAISRR